MDKTMHLVKKYEQPPSHAESGMIYPNEPQQNFIKGNNEVILSLLLQSTLDTALMKGFQALGDNFQVDRITLFKNQTDPETGEISMTLFEEWTSPGTCSALDKVKLSKIPYQPDLKDFLTSLENHTPIIALTTDLHHTSRIFLRKMEIKSVMVMPVFVRHRLWGFLGLGDCQKSRIWMEEEQDSLHTISAILGAVIQKHQDQEELTIARLRAEESDRLKSSILANINHEFRTPMTGILGFSEILCEESQDSETREIAANIRNSGKRLLGTLNSMIELAQFEARKIEFKLVETKLNELILMVCEPHIQAAKKKHLGFNIHMNESIFSYIEENQFTQILNHLIDNALKFTDDGEITIETYTKTEHDRIWSCISVSDTGPGIPDEFHEVIFEEFRQVSEGYNRNFEGNGLGLTLAKKIATLMNGRITLKSKPGNGSIFTLWLPSSQFTHSTPVMDDAPVELENNTVFTFNHEPKTAVTDQPIILIVEDNRLNSELIQIYLRNYCRCTFAQTGEEAVALAHTTTYHAILMDINLGTGIDGMEATRQIRQLPQYSETPIVAITGYTLDSDQQEIKEAGCSHYLPKPVNKRDLLQLMTTFFPKN